MSQNPSQPHNPLTDS